MQKQMHRMSKEAYGPRTQSPAYYVGESLGNKQILKPDVQRHGNGAAAGIRDKGARRIIRRAFGERLRNIAGGLKLVRDMRMQAREVAHATGRSRNAVRHLAKRLLAKELALHQTVTWL